MTDEIQHSEYGPVKSLLREISQLAGKTILLVTQESINWSEYLVFRATDGSALVLRQTYEDQAWSDYPSMFDADYDLPARVFLGLAPDEELISQKQREDAEVQANKEREERATLARLKQKYESGN